MCRSVYITLILSIIALCSYAQDIPQTETESKIFEQIFYEDTHGTDVRVIQEEKLDEILKMFIEQNKELGGIPCYWIRIYSGSGHNARDDANRAKARFLKRYEGIRINVKYDPPNFKVYVGGYRSKSETQKILNDIKKDFRNPFMIYDVIDFPIKPQDRQIQVNE